MVVNGLYYKQSIDRLVNVYNAWFVAKGFHQLHRIDYSDIFNPVLKPTTICIVRCGCSIHQLDVPNAFLHCELIEEV